MSTEREMIEQQAENTEKYYINAGDYLHTNLLKMELKGIYGDALLKDINDILQLYSIYDKGAKFVTEGAKDYVPSNLKFKNAKTLVDKEARFMLSKTPSFYVQTGDDDKDNKISETTQAFLNEVLKRNMFGKKVLQGGKDCFIGKRVAMFVNFDDDGITINFAPSLEFVYEVDDNNVDKIIKIIRYYSLNDVYDKKDQRIYKKKYWLEKDGYCHIEEGIYNGAGGLIEMKNQDLKTKLPFIPAFVIVNDGLTGDPFGESEIDVLRDHEKNFNKMSNADIDSLRKGMNQIVYTIDMNPESTKALKRSPGAFWDLSSDEIVSENSKSGTVGTVENDMTYSTALDNTLNRIKSSMYEMLDIPETNADALKGVIQSGKTLKALYWGLMTRCDEKMLTWRPALEWLARTIIEGAKIYTNSMKVYDTTGTLAQKYEVSVENNYPLLEDEIEEKETDMAEVTNKVMSRKAYMKKWRELTDDEVKDELAQIAMERQMLEESYVPDTFNTDDPESDPNKNKEGQ